jgi:hypothetical protein
MKKVRTYDPSGADLSVTIEPTSPAKNMKAQQAKAIDKGGFETLEGKSKEDDFSLKALDAVRAMKEKQAEEIAAAILAGSTPGRS